jgi:catalase
VRTVMDDAARDRLVSNIVGALLNGVSEKVLQRAFWYFRNVDKDLGDRVEKGVRAGQAGSQPTSAEQEVNKVRAAAPVNA